MAVLIEGYSVVVRNATLAAKYPGGMDAYAQIDAADVSSRAAPALGPRGRPSE